LKFEDKHYDALVHFVATFIVSKEQEAKTFVDELSSAFQRKEVTFKVLRCYRIDNDAELLQLSRDYHNFQHSISTATIKIERFFLENPDQTKTLAENMTEKFFTGLDSTALIGQKCNIPVRVLEKESRNPLTNDIYYFTVEHLTPKG